MKKFLLSIFCMLSIMNYAYADEVKFDFTAPSGLTPSITDDMYSDGGNGALAFNTDETTFTANGVTLNTTKGSMDSRIWKSAKGVYDFRVYKTATMTIAAPEGGVITAIAFDGSTVNSFSANSGTVDGKNWTGSASSVVFTWADEAKTQKINSITVTFATDGGVTPDPEEPEGGEGEGEGEGEVTYLTIAEVIAAGAGEAATKGIVVATYARGFLMDDGTGSILVYLGSDNGYAAGDAVTVSGKTSVYGGLLQFGNTSVAEKTGTATVEHPTATVMDGAAMDAYLAAPAIQYVEYTGTLTISGNYYNVAVDSAATAIGSIQYPQDAIKANLTSGSVVKVTGYTIGVSSNKYVNTMVVKVETVDNGGNEGEGEGGETPEEPETPSSDYLNETFATDLGSFTTQETVGSYPWVFAANYGAKASGYADGASQNAESWLISPAMDLTGETKASIAFDYVINKGDVNAAATNHKLLITSDYTGDVTTTEWTEVEYGAVNNGNWTFNNTGNIALPESMMNKPAVVIAFKYVSTTENSSTWEIKNVVVSGEKGATVEPEEPEGGETPEEIEVTDISDIIAAGEGKAKAQGTIVATYARGFLLDDGTGSILVYLGSDNGNVAGEIVTVEGTTSMYGGLLQFAQGSVVEVLTTGTVEYPTATVMDGAAMDAYLAAPAIQYVEYTGTLTISGNYYNVAVDGAATAVASIQYPHDAIKANLTSGSVVKVTGYTIGVSSSKYVNTMAVKVETVGEGGGEPEEPEVPTETQEYTVTEALAAYVDGKQIPAIVTGYIVGAVKSAPEKDSQFGPDTAVETNILISDNAETLDYTECLIVQLPSGDIRSALNLVDNPGNYKKQVKITGSVEKYFRVAGLKVVTAYEFTGATGISEVKGENGTVKTIYDLTGRRVENIIAPGIYIVGGKKVLVR